MRLGSAEREQTPYSGTGRNPQREDPTHDATTVRTCLLDPFTAGRYAAKRGPSDTRDYSALHSVISVARILIVDDDEADRIVLGTILERAGHEAFFAEDGEEALGEYGGHAIDIVITNLQMPRVHGLDLITLLRNVSPRPAIIAISGTGLLDFAKEAGADATLTKPVDRIELLSAVAMAVTGKD